MYLLKGTKDMSDIRLNTNDMIVGTKIVLDLEFTRVDKSYSQMKKLSKFEVIQFGAVKLDSNNDIIGRYESFVKPRYSAHIEESVSILTHITDRMLKEAPDYIEVINGFLDWAGNTKYVMSWSTTDLLQLRAESRQKEFEDTRLTEMFNNWIDLQKCFGDELGLEHQISLINAIKGIGLDFMGMEHSAIDDAENTAYIYQAMQNEGQFKEKYKEIVDLFKPTPALGTSLGSMFGDIFNQIVYE